MVLTQFKVFLTSCLPTCCTRFYEIVVYHASICIIYLALYIIKRIYVFYSILFYSILFYSMNIFCIQRLYKSKFCKECTKDVHQIPTCIQKMYKTCTKFELITAWKLKCTLCLCILYIQQDRPWHDARAIACTRTITHANQEKRGLRGQSKACSVWANIARAKF